MQLRFEIPDTFWSLFRSVNREIYMEALLCINQEYEYSNYFLTRELCLQVLADMNARNRIRLQREDSETDYDMLETPASRVLNWLVHSGWSECSTEPGCGVLCEIYEAGLQERDVYGGQQLDV